MGYKLAHGTTRLKIENLDIRFDDGVATISGEVVKTEPGFVPHVVESGDTLSKIATEHYGNVNKYPAIFEANKFMLSRPNLTYPGHVLGSHPKPGPAVVVPRRRSSLQPSIPLQSRWTR